MMFRKLIGACVGLAMVGVAGSASATIIYTIPTGLSPGDQYRLVFVTSDQLNATSQGINDYNDFVTAAANTQPELVALGTTWKAIGSTLVDARDNTGTNPTVSVGSPIYLLDGVTKIADNNADLWDGALAAPLTVFENGNAAPHRDVWTGTNFDGTGAGVNVLGSIGGGSNIPPVVFGVNDFIDGRWLGFDTEGGTFRNSLYGLSGILVSPVPVPEPSTIALFVTGLAGLGFMLRRRRSHRYSAPIQ